MMPVVSFWNAIRPYKYLSGIRTLEHNWPFRRAAAQLTVTQCCIQDQRLPREDNASAHSISILVAMQWEEQRQAQPPAQFERMQARYNQPNNLALCQPLI